MPDRIEFIVNGAPLTLSRQQVEAAVADVGPEPIRSHAVVVADTRYPVKQVFSAATGLDRLDFTSTTARRHLRSLGFAIERERP